MNRLFVGILVGLGFVAMVPTTASATFRCLAHGSNGVSHWASGIRAETAQSRAVRFCRSAGGHDCRIVHCQ